MIEKLFERWLLLPLAPGAELVAGLLLFGAVVLIFRGRSRRGGAGVQQTVLPSVVRVTSAAVIAVWVIDVVTRVFWVRFPVVAWWSLLLPLIVAAAGLALVLLRWRAHAVRAGVPALPAVRRTWRSFTSRGVLLAVGLVAVVLVIATVAAGAVSIPDENGALIFLPLAGSGVSSFYGWALGVPVLIGVALLTCSTVAALSTISAQPFASPNAVASETYQRRVDSNAVVSLTGAALALTLGGAAQIIGQAGAAGMGEVVWTTGFSAFAQLFIWTGWALQVTALATLIALASGWSPARTFVSPVRVQSGSPREA